MYQVKKLFEIALFPSSILVDFFVAIILNDKCFVQGNDPIITPNDAKRIAENYTGGKAISIFREISVKSQVYEVVIDTDSGFLDIGVDDNSGEILEL